MNGKVSAVKNQLNYQTVEKTELIQPESESVYLIRLYTCYCCL